MDRTITDNEKQSLLNKMVKEVLKTKKELDTHNYNEVYAMLNLIDHNLDKKGYTEVHPSRYQIVKLLEKAKQYL